MQGLGWPSGRMLVEHVVASGAQVSTVSGEVASLPAPVGLS
jgi:hypothetical protein